MSDYVEWWIRSKGATLNLAKLHPALEAIELECRWRDWMARVKVGEITIQVMGDNRLEALANLLNCENVLKRLDKEE